MIRKNRNQPIKLLKTNALLRRISVEHPKRHDIEQDCLGLSAGYKGERALDYHLNFLPRDNLLILHDLRLDDKISYFQLDTLILHPSFFLIVEVKNFSGTLYFDPIFDQMIRTKNGVEEVFPDPVRQVNRQASQLMTWLKNRKYRPVPVETVVVMANSQALLKTSPDNQACLEKVIRDTRLVDTIRLRSEKHRDEIFPISELRKLASLLIRNDTPLNPDVLMQYSITPSELVTGVRCPECGATPMEREWGKWLCPHCSCKSKDAHLEALRDYGLLVGQTISNRQARDFLRLPTSSDTKYLLRSLDVDYNGKTKGRKYHLAQLLN